MSYCADTFVDYVHSILSRYESNTSGSAKLPHGELLVPLGAMKVVYDAVFKKVIHWISALYFQAILFIACL